MHRIPARPVIEPAIEQSKDRIGEVLREAFVSAIEGNSGGAMAGLEKAGLYAEGQVKDYFTSGGLAPNAPITINGGWMRNRKSGKPFKVKGKGSSSPLIDTSDLKSSITHVIRSK